MGYDGVEALNGFVERLRDFPATSAPEDTMRELFKEEEFYNGDAVRRTIDQLLEVIDADPEIEVFPNSRYLRSKADED